MFCRDGLGHGVGRVVLKAIARPFQLVRWVVRPSRGLAHVGIAFRRRRSRGGRLRDCGGGDSAGDGRGCRRDTGLGGGDGGD